MSTPRSTLTTTSPCPGAGQASAWLSKPWPNPNATQSWCTAGVGPTAQARSFFCSNGLLGVAPDDLYHDYELTSLSGVGRRLASGEEFQNMLAVLHSYAPVNAPLPQQIEGYLGDIGVTPEQISFLRAHLVKSIA